METAVIQAASPQWWIVGWFLSILLLIMGFAFSVLYYEKGDKSTSPEADNASEQEGTS